MRAVLLLVLRRYEETIEACEKAAKLGQKGTIEVSRGIALHSLGRTEEAFEWYQRAIEQDPYDAESQDRMGSILLMSGHFQKALDAYTRAIALDPSRKKLIKVRSMLVRIIENNQESQLAEAIGYTPHIMNDDTSNEAQDAKREVTARVDDLKLPTSDLNWPNEKYDNSPERGSRKHKNILTFLRRVWVPFIEENDVLVSRQILEQRDPLAWQALKNYLAHNELPSDIPILKAAEFKDRAAQRPVSAIKLHQKRMPDMH